MKDTEMKKAVNEKNEQIFAVGIGDCIYKVYVDKDGDKFIKSRDNLYVSLNWLEQQRYNICLITDPELDELMNKLELSRA